MVSRSRLSGVYAAVVTPFDRGQRVDLDWMTQHITFVRRAGIHGIVVCGTNGEGQWLSAAERRAIVEHVSIHKKSLRLIAGAGFNSLTETAEFAAFWITHSPGCRSTNSLSISAAVGGFTVIITITNG